MENVERDTRKLPRIQRRQDVGLVLQAAAARIAERGAVRQPIEQGLVEHAFGVVRQCQETEENLVPLPAILPHLHTVECPSVCVLLWPLLSALVPVSLPRERPAAGTATHAET